MIVVSGAVAGTLESSDAYVRVEPWESLEIEIASVVQRQYGQQIRQAVEAVLQEQGITAGRIQVQDRGALDCVIRARVETALARCERR